MFKGAFGERKYFAVNEQGMALVMVLVFTLLIFATGAALLEIALKENLVAGYHAFDIKQHYLAEAGLEAGLYLLNSGEPVLGDLCFALEGGLCKVQFKESVPAEAYIVTATGIGDLGSTTLMAEAHLNEAGFFELQKWLKAKGDE